MSDVKSTSDDHPLSGHLYHAGVSRLHQGVGTSARIHTLELICPLLRSAANLESIQSLPGYLCVNKDGKGDATGTIPQELGLDLMADYFIGGQVWLKQARDELMSWFQLRCKSPSLSS